MKHIAPALSADCHPTPLDALDEDVVPAGAHFLRTHFGVPQIDPATWTLEVTGAVERPLRWSLGQLQHLSRTSQHVVLECAGHRRTELDPPAPGVPWGVGAVGHARWSGGSLADLLSLVRPTAEATTIVFVGADRGPVEGREAEEPFARAVPLSDSSLGKAILAWEMNGRGLEPEHGAPVRLIVPGWYAVASVKWLTRIELIAGDFDGFFQAVDYRIIERGEEGPGRPLTTMPVHSLITGPAADAVVPTGPLTVHGLAWGGTNGIAGVDVCLDDGDWLPARVEPGPGVDAPTRFRLDVEVAAGRHAVRSRARDRTGAMQPEADTWNARGYGVSSAYAVGFDAR